MLRISQKLEYATRAMIELANRQEGGGEALVPAREIAESQQIPLRFLEQQLGTLAKAGLIESHRGAGGGCRLARPSSQVSMKEVAEAIEGPFQPMFCLEPGDETCFQDSQCGLQSLWGDVSDAVTEVFSATTVADLAKRHRKMSPPIFTPEDLVRR
jgi:Rrf2 family transcriptional regulator, iron-sulfur cluster assembly transcription factor